jgi:hypothetical protein
MYTHANKCKNDEIKKEKEKKKYLRWRIYKKGTSMSSQRESLCKN